MRGVVWLSLPSSSACYLPEMRIDRDRDDPLRVVLADHILVQRLHDGTRLQCLVQHDGVPVVSRLLEVLATTIISCQTQMPILSIDDTRVR
jgi:hypothetical protein